MNPVSVYFFSFFFLLITLEVSSLRGRLVRVEPLDLLVQVVHQGGPRFLLEHLPRLLPEEHSALVVKARGEVVYPVDLHAVRVGDQAAELQVAVLAPQGVAGDGGPAGPVQRREEGTLAKHRGVSVWVVERVQVGKHGVVPLPAGDPDGALRDGGEHLLQREHAGDLVLEVEPPKAGVRQQGRGHVPLLQLPQPALHVAPEVHHLEAGVLGQDLRPPPERRGADHAVLRQGGKAVADGRDEGVPDVLPGQVAGQHRAGGKVGWHVLHGVHRDVDPTVQQGLVHLLGEEALAANVRERLRQDLVAGGLDDLDLDGAVLRELGVALLEQIPRQVGLRQGERRPPRADLHQRGLPLGGLGARSGSRAGLLGSHAPQPPRPHHRAPHAWPRGMAEAKPRRPSCSPCHPFHFPLFPYGSFFQGR
mmetsp:Transcript_84/g.278  ORF Transcript_84/g.278 Transcript_84/m.278 type:complete len:419 (+) Transcript_84:28-1284(+)